ncbi:unnamed protein product [Durusdinium trenchii]|uniref:Uncharacterized protein n=1 Tax=Durusdinium trenchii TaxID=1381693 RepID=A0ABP0REF2_9DINO
MSWRKGQKQLWTEPAWQEEKWAKDGWARKNRKKEEPKEKPVFYGYDGKPVHRDGGSGRPSSQSTSKQEMSVTEENTKLKATIRFLAQKVAATDEVPEDVQDYLKEDPREALKARQRELNQERKVLNRTAKLKDDIRKKEEKFRTWKEDIEAGVKSETQRVNSTLAELQEALKAAENGEVIHLEDDESKEQIPETMRQEVEALRAGYGQMESYLCQMEARNQQMAAQMQTMMETFQTMGKSRSRSPIRVKTEEMEEEISSAEIKARLSMVPEAVQMCALQRMQDNPSQFKTGPQVEELIAQALEEFKEAQIKPIVALVPDAETSQALKPFGKSAALKESERAAPYPNGLPVVSTPRRSETRLHGMS